MSADGALRRFSHRRGSCAAPGSKRALSPDADSFAIWPTDARSSPGARAVRERGGGGRDLCVSENPVGSDGQRDYVTGPLPRPRPLVTGSGGGTEPGCAASSRSRVTSQAAGPWVELERASAVEDAFLFLTRLSAFSLPPSDFLTRARFSMSSHVLFRALGRRPPSPPRSPPKY